LIYDVSAFAYDAAEAFFSFKYDPFGRRIYKSSSSGTSIYAYDGVNLVEEANSSGAAVARYTQQGINTDEPLAMLRSSTTSYYEADGLGSVTSLSNGAGSLAQTYTFDSFGNQTASTGSLTNPFRYTAREFDTETALYYMRTRYFDPATGRFLTEDTIGFDGDGPNFYAYVGNSPTDFTDPFGLAQCFYRISTHTLTCTENAAPPVGPRLSIQVGPDDVSSGLDKCKDQPSCSGIKDIGPIQPGEYKVNPDNRPGHKDWFRLEPQPTIPGWQFWKRNGFALHLGTFSLGCITVNKSSPAATNQFQDLQRLLQSEAGNNYLLVAP
jgi:RHS repeat-associated protein